MGSTRSHLVEIVVTEGGHDHSLVRGEGVQNKRHGARGSVRNVDGKPSQVVDVSWIWRATRTADGARSTRGGIGGSAGTAAADQCAQHEHDGTNTHCTPSRIDREQSTDGTE